MCKEVRDWLEGQGKSVSWLARRLGCPASTITNYVNGTRPWDGVVAFAVEELAGGEVKARDIILPLNYRESPLASLRSEEV